VNDFRLLDSAFRHGVTEADILSVIYNSFDSKDVEGTDNRLRYGFDSKGNVVEVAYDHVERVVFHAMRVHNTANRLREKRKR
jgi:hypothetical protein